MDLLVDLGVEAGNLSFCNGRCISPLPYVRGHQLTGYPSGIDQGEPRDEGHQGEAPDPGCLMPMAGQHTGCHDLPSLHCDRQSRDRYDHVGEERDHALDGEECGSSTERDSDCIGRDINGLQLPLRMRGDRRDSVTRHGRRRDIG
jgi:hypothetical protein